MPRQLASRFGPLSLLAGGALALVLALLPGPTVTHAASGFYEQTNLVSDLSGVAARTDANLVNPWGLSHSPTGPWVVSDNGTGLATRYKGNGNPLGGMPSPVTIALPTGVTTGMAAPTGTVFNSRNQIDPQDFVVTAHGKSGASEFLFATEDGTISGWNPKVDATHSILEVDNSQVPTSGDGAVYKGLALGRSGGHDFLYATNFRAAHIDVFDAHFHPAQLSGSFQDATIPAGYAPFNIANIGGELFVTYALQNAAKHDDAAGAGHGFIDVFDTAEHLLRRLVAHSSPNPTLSCTLNSPWGMALAPSDFGRFSGALLVGNFGAKGVGSDDTGHGLINAFDPKTGACRGQLRDRAGNPITNDSLWGLAFGNGRQAGKATTLFFTVGLEDETHGLFGKIEAEGA